jgi:hypothetical protein
LEWARNEVASADGIASRSVSRGLITWFSAVLPAIAKGLANGFLFSQEAEVGRMLGFGWVIVRYSVKRDAENPS